MFEGPAILAAGESPACCAEERSAVFSRGFIRQLVRRPACGDLYLGGLRARPCGVHISRQGTEQRFGRGRVEGRGEPRINVERAQVRDGGIASAAADLGHGQPGLQREGRFDEVGQFGGCDCRHECRCFGDGVGGHHAAARVAGDTVHAEPGAQHATASGNHVIRPRVADHHPIDSARCIGALEVRSGASEIPSVLVHVEQQHQAARHPVR